MYGGQGEACPYALTTCPLVRICLATCCPPHRTAGSAQPLTCGAERCCGYPPRLRSCFALLLLRRLWPYLPSLVRVQVPLTPSRNIRRAPLPPPHQGPEGVSRIYSDEVFRLRIEFGEQYPLDPPDITFVPPSPVHPHIYRCVGTRLWERGPPGGGPCGRGLCLGSPTRLHAVSSSAIELLRPGWRLPAGLRALGACQHRVPPIGPSIDRPCPRPVFTHHAPPPNRPFACQLAATATYAWTSCTRGKRRGLGGRRLRCLLSVVAVEGLPETRWAEGGGRCLAMYTAHLGFDLADEHYGCQAAAAGLIYHH